MENQKPPSDIQVIMGIGFFTLLGAVLLVLGLADLDSNPESIGAVLVGGLVVLATVLFIPYARKVAEKRRKEFAKAQRKKEKEETSYIAAPTQSSNSMSLLFTVAVIALFGWLAFKGLGYVNNKYIKKYDKPWWSGTKLQRVCTTGGGGNCYSLSATSDGENINIISFPNGGYLYGESECFQAASFYDYDRFCRFYDQEGRKWDVIPL